jgi:hypothetical protein
MNFAGSQDYNLSALQVNQLAGAQRAKSGFSKVLGQKAQKCSVSVKN